MEQEVTHTFPLLPSRQHNQMFRHTPRGDEFIFALRNGINEETSSFSCVFLKAREMEQKQKKREKECRRQSDIK